MKSKSLLTLLLAVLLLDLAATATVDPGSSGTGGIHSSVLTRSTEGRVDLRSRFAGGDGTVENPYQIANVTQLQDINHDIIANYTLVNDIDASDTSNWSE